MLCNVLSMNSCYFLLLKLNVLSEICKTFGKWNPPYQWNPFEVLKFENSLEDDDDM